MQLKKILLLVLVGGIVSLSVACSSTSPSRSKWQRGYTTGMADAAKRQYFAQRNLYKYQYEQQKNKIYTRRYTFVIPPDPNATEKKVPYTITIPARWTPGWRKGGICFSKGYSSSFKGVTSKKTGVASSGEFFSTAKMLKLENRF